MSERLQKVTVNVPADLLAQAMKQTQAGITATILEGLRELDRKRKRLALADLMGKVHIDIDLEKTRR